MSKGIGFRIGCGLLIIFMVVSVAGCARASFEVSNLAVEPAQANVGEAVNASLEVKNTGTASGTYTAALTINGETMEAKDIILSAGESDVVTFTFAKNTTGTYDIAVGGLSETLTVVKAAYQSLDYFPITEGYGIKYHLTDDYHALDCNVWAVSQYFETNKPNKLDFVFTLIKEGTEGGYFRNSCLGGEVSRSIDGRNSTLFYCGSPSGNQATFYRSFSLPSIPNPGDEWIVAGKKYSVEYVGAQTINGTEFGDCIKITMDDSLNDNEYSRGSGYFILARDVGIVKLVLDRTNGQSALYDYEEHQQLTKHAISGTVNDGGVPVEGIIVQISNSDWGIRSATDSNGAFSIQAYGPDIVLRIGYDEDNDDLFNFDVPNYPKEYCVNNITADVVNLSIDISTL